MARLSHTVEFVAALTASRLARLLSARAADRFGAGLGLLVHRCWKSRRQVALDNLRQALGHMYTDRELRGIVRRVFKNIGRTTVEIVRLGKTGLQGVLSIVEGNGAEGFRKVYDEGKGAVLMTAHFGNWEMLGCWPAALGYPVDFLVGELHNRQVDRLLNRFRHELAIGIISVPTGVRDVFKSLKSNRFACVVADQHAPASKIIVEFFGRRAAAPKGPAAFAIAAGCPLYPFLMRRERYDRHVVMPGTPIYPPNTGDADRDIAIMTEAYMKFFEAGIRQYPDQWMWTHRRWKPLD